MASTEDENGMLPIYKRPKDDNEDPVPETDPTDKAKVDEESVPEVADDAKQDKVNEEMNGVVSNDLDTDEKKEEMNDAISMIVINPIYEFVEKNIAQEVKNLAEKARSNLDSTPPTVIEDFHVIIYIHGFDNSEEDMKKRSKLLDDALGTRQLISTSLNWKSQDSVMGYKEDQKCAEKLAQYLCQYLTTIRETEIFKDKQINIIAHSMGNHLLCQGINAATEKQLDVFKGVNIVCFAADESVEEYEKAIGNLNEIVQSWTHWWYERDNALWASEHIKNHDRRAGRHDISEDMNKKGDIKKGADLVQSHEWDSSLKIGLETHSYIVNISPNAKHFDKNMQDQVRSVLGLNKQ